MPSNMYEDAQHYPMVMIKLRQLELGGCKVKLELHTNGECRTELEPYGVTLGTYESMVELWGALHDAGHFEWLKRRVQEMVDGLGAIEETNYGLH